MKVIIMKGPLRCSIQIDDPEPSKEDLEIHLGGDVDNCTEGRLTVEELIALSEDFHTAYGL
jgi:hypothetical protein